MKLSLILLAGLAGATCLRTRSAALRHWVLAVAILCAGASPFMQHALNDWPLNLRLPAGPSLGQTAVGVEVSVTEKSDEAALAAPRVHPANAVKWLAWIWLAGAAFSLTILGAGIARLAWLTSRAPQASARWIDFAEQICREQQLRRPVRLIQSDHPALLATWGVIQPRIIFPSAASGWSDDLVRAILRHEVAHIRRYDWLMQMAGELLRAVYWFNPLVWLACRRLRSESEQACDDEVLGTGTEPCAYAAHLLTLARYFSQHRAWFPAPAMARRSTLHRRVAAMLNSRTDRRPLALTARFATLALLLGATLAIAAAQTAATFSGTVVDPQGGVLPGVRVTLTDAQNQAQETETNSSGQFQFRGLPAGGYVVRVQLPGFKSYQATVTVANTNVAQTIALEVGQVQETINVTDAVESAMPTTRESAPRSIPACGPQPATSGVRIGGNIRPPSKFKDVHPIYPASLRGTGASGDVVLDAVLGTDGFIHDIRAREGSQQAFVDAFIEAVTQWKFDSTLLNCVPVETPITITGHFRPQAN
jgi:beta-lactamase regulating signal transducer with metallopeptidase domain